MKAVSGDLEPGIAAWPLWVGNQRRMDSDGQGRGEAAIWRRVGGTWMCPVNCRKNRMCWWVWGMGVGVETQRSGQNE